MEPVLQVPFFAKTHCEKQMTDIALMEGASCAHPPQSCMKTPLECCRAHLKQIYSRILSFSGQGIVNFFPFVSANENVGV